MQNSAPLLQFSPMWDGSVGQAIHDPTILANVSLFLRTYAAASKEVVFAPA